MVKLSDVRSRHHAVAAALLSLSAGAIAEPRVQGNTITWPANGWYQVQDATSYVSLCEGGSQCEVPDGRYIVINHTTGQRFEGIAVPVAGSDTVRVQGQVILWPDDGWYQVQDATSYASLCEGGSQCEVPDGVYIVINHTTGQRFESVRVPAGPPVLDSVVVTGNTISWPDDGWYQVQDASSYVSLCEGGRSCEVADGRYHVINHTTGKRYENLLVEGDQGTEPPDDPVISAANALPLLQAITEIINEVAIREFLETIRDEVTPQSVSRIFPVPSPQDHFADHIGPDSGEPTDYIMAVPEVGQAARLFDYACFGGGSVKSYIASNSFRDTVMQDCVIGAATHDGTVSRRMNTLRGEYPTTHYFDYQRIGSDGSARTLSGQGRLAYFHAFSGQDPLDYRYTWNALQFASSSGGMSDLLITDHSLMRDFEKLWDLEQPFCRDVEIDGASVSISEYTARDIVSGGFDVQADWSDGQILSVSLDLTSLDQVRVACGQASNDFNGYDPYTLSPWSGQIQVEAADGSQMVVLPASDAGEDENAFIIELGNGEQLGPFDWGGEYEILTRPWERDE